MPGFPFKPMPSESPTGGKRPDERPPETHPADGKPLVEVVCAFLDGFEESGVAC